MGYQELYNKYQEAIRLRELKADKNYELLKEIFNKKIVSSISMTSESKIIPYLAGIKDVFSYVEHESVLVDSYRDELDTLFAERNA